MMHCTLCRLGSTQPGLTTVALVRDGSTVVIKDVPADVCDNCEEYYLSEEVADRVLSVAEAAVQAGAEVEIRRYAAA